MWSRVYPLSCTCHDLIRFCAELLGTTQCSEECRDGGGAAVSVLVASLLTMFISLYLVFVRSRPPDQKTTTKKSVMLRDENIAFNQILFGPLLYYSQSLDLILSTRGIKLWMTPVLSALNFSFEAVDKDAGGLCWSDGLDAKARSCSIC